MPSEPTVVVIISANIEWQVIREIFAGIEPNVSPLGEWFVTHIDVRGDAESVVFFHGGWGKIAAAASTQYVIDRWSPALLVNFGTCGGFEGQIEKGTIVLAERTVVYDIVDEMVGSATAIAHYATDIDLAWLGESYPHPVHRGLLVSGDRDLQVDDMSHLIAAYGAVAGDWESGAIAWVAARNDTKLLILRGVTDLVGSAGGEAYDGNIHVFVAGATKMLQRLVEALPAWLAKAT